MLGSIYIGLSGMTAHSQGLQTISNNVANMNSPGFKASSVSFEEVLGQGQSGGSSGGPDGGGVRYGGEQVDFSQGDLRQTGGELDLAIQGDGMLVLLDGEARHYARTGQFEVNSEGFIVDRASGHQLGVLNAGNELVPVNVDVNAVSAPVATTTIAFSENLSSTGTEAAVSNIAVYDATGAKQVWKVEFKAVGASAPGEWKVTVTDQAGVPVGGEATLKFLTGGAVDPATQRITVTPSQAGASPVILDFSGGVTSFSSGTSSSLRSSSVDGRAAGEVTSVGVDSEGKVKLTYSNADSLTLGSIALADFSDMQQLERAGGGMFDAVGGEAPRLVASGQPGVGRLVSQQIEASNVDLAAEFGELILVQRGFQASSQVVSVSNDMIQQLFGIRGQG